MLSSICIRDVAAYSLLMSDAVMLLELMLSKLLLLIRTIRLFREIRVES